jgi:hypothetical protein
MDIPGILTFVDYEKAFDTVNHKFMMKCLQHMNTSVMESVHYTIIFKLVSQIIGTSVNFSNQPEV